MASNAESKTTTDHDEIRNWAEKRGGQPACVKGTGGEGDVGLLRIDFPGYSGEDSLQHISWDEFFGKFDERGLALLYQETTAGGAESNFNKLVSRETAEQKTPAKTTRARKATAKKTSAKKATAKAVPKKKAAAVKRPAKKAATRPAAKKTTRRASR